MNFPIANTLSVLDQAVLEILHPPMGIQVEGWKNFNLHTGGLREKEFTIICGPTGSGKTLFLANLTAWLISNDTKVFFAPVEIGEHALTKMILSVYAKEDFTFGDEPTMEQKSKLKWTLQNYQEKISNNLCVTTYDGRVDVDEMIDLLSYAHDTHGAKVAILDNLNFFLKPTSAQNANIEVDEAVHKFVQFAKKTPMHIILVMHPKKTEGGKVLSEFDIKGSSTAVQEATNVLLMNRLTDDECNDLGLSAFDRELVFKKIRKRGRYVNVKFYMRNTNANGRYEESARSNAGYVSGASKPLAKVWGGRKSTTAKRNEAEV